MNDGLHIAELEVEVVADADPSVEVRTEYWVRSYNLPGEFKALDTFTSTTFTHDSFRVRFTPEPKQEHRGRLFLGPTAKIEESSHPPLETFLRQHGWGQERVIEVDSQARRWPRLDVLYAEQDDLLGHLEEVYEQAIRERNDAAASVAIVRELVEAEEDDLGGTGNPREEATRRLFALRYYIELPRLQTTPPRPS